MYTLPMQLFKCVKVNQINSKFYYIFWPLVHYPNIYLYTELQANNIQKHALVSSLANYYGGADRIPPVAILVPQALVLPSKIISYLIN